MFDCIVVGAGHAGCEATMVLSRMGLRVLLVTGNVDRIGHLSCNPAIGGLAKGHMVREIDALGGMMGLWADAAGIQFRTLNASKGPAVRATRAQIDRDAYMSAVKASLFAESGVSIWQDTVSEVLSEKGRVSGVRTELGREFAAPHVILTTGTFLRGLIHIGLTHFPGGRLGDAGVFGAVRLACRARTAAREAQDRNHAAPAAFVHRLFPYGGTARRRSCAGLQLSWATPRPAAGFLLCDLDQHATHDAIRAGMDRSPLFTGVIEGTGARYCPSVEDKVARFPDRDRHHVFIEPEGLNGQECYANGISTSLPLDVQLAMIATIPGLEHARMVRPGYAIEYDYADPVQLEPTLETRVLRGCGSRGRSTALPDTRKPRRRGCGPGSTSAVGSPDGPRFCPDATRPIWPCWWTIWSHGERGNRIACSLPGPNTACCCAKPTPTRG